MRAAIAILVQAAATKQRQKANAETSRDAKQAQRRDTSRAPRLFLGIAY